MKRLLVIALAVSACLLRLQASTIGWGAQNSNSLGTSTGGLAAQGSVVRLGYFTVSDSTVQSLAAAGDKAGLDAAFQEFGTDTVGAGYGLNGIWGSSSVNGNAAFAGKRIYYWTLNAPTLAAATQWGIFTDPADPAWVFPSDSPLPGSTNTELANVPQDGTGLIVGSFAGGPDPNFGTPLYRMANIPGVPELASLTLAGVTLSQPFDPATISYAARLVASKTSIILTPTGTGTIKVNGVVVASGTASAPIPVPSGSSVITIELTAPDGVTKTTYTITMTRPVSTNANLAFLRSNPGTLSPVFAAAATAYSTKVANSVASITVTPTASHAYATVKVNGTGVASGTASGPIALSVGPNPINVVVTAENGVTKKTYVLTVTRQPAFTGSYDGLATPTVDAISPRLDVGLGTLTVTATGAFTGNFKLGGSGDALPVSGVFDVDGVARFGTARTPTLDLLRPGLGGTLTLALHLDVQFPLTHQIMGTLSQNTVVLSTIELNRRLYTSVVPAVAPLMNVPVSILDPATDKGKNTAIFQSLDPTARSRAASTYPQGDGWALVTVKDTGAVTVAGALADGQAFTYSNYLSKDNVLPFYLPLYSGTGSVSGQIQFRDVPGQSDADGLGLVWFKPANPTDTAYKNGWPAGIKVDYLGSKLVARAISGKTMLGNSPAVAPTVNAVLALSDAGLTGLLKNTLTLTSPGGVVVHGAPSGFTAAQSLTASLYQSGTLQGSFSFPVSNTTTQFNGVVFQKLQRASGYFLAPAGGSAQQSGAVTITAQ